MGVAVGDRAGWAAALRSRGACMRAQPTTHARPRHLRKVGLEQVLYILCRLLRQLLLQHACTSREVVR